MTTCTSAKWNLTFHPVRTNTTVLVYPTDAPVPADQRRSTSTSHRPTRLNSTGQKIVRFQSVVNPFAVDPVKALYTMSYSSNTLRLPSQPQNVTALWPVSNYTAWPQRQAGVSSPRPLQGGSRPGLEPAACESHVRCPTNNAIAPLQTGEGSKKSTDRRNSVRADITKSNWRWVTFSDEWVTMPRLRHDSFSSVMTNGRQAASLNHCGQPSRLYTTISTRGEGQEGGVNKLLQFRPAVITNMRTDHTNGHRNINYVLTLSVPHFSDCSKMSLPNRSGPYWSNPPLF